MCIVGEMNKLQITLAVIKPHVVKNLFALESIQKRIECEFEVVGIREVVISREMAERFYAEHRSKFFYNRLLSFITSGPSVALILAAENAVSKWRQIMGPTKVYKTIYSEPDTIRGQFGLSDTRNACHGSDAMESALNEINVFFPDFDFEEWRKNHPTL
ncbi:nucleoside diphosphate kinase 6-like [Hermetia illucens]|nr:nucleoside diphosphate kinase 6-like [Hermetia illucens]